MSVFASQFDGKTDEEVRAILAAERSPLLDAWRLAMCAALTSQLIIHLTHDEDIVKLFEAEESDDLSDASIERHERVLRAAIVAVGDELDARIPPRGKP